MSLDFDSEGETSFDEEEERFSWRMDPTESLSDWEIVVIDEGGEYSDTYNVHKNMLSVGARKCEYFIAPMKKDGGFTECSLQSSTIHLNTLAAKAFPDMLDYVYDGVVNCKTENSAALHYLGGYFGVRRLRWHVKQFMKQNIQASNADVYFMHAAIFHDEKIQSAVADACVHNLLSIDVTSRLLQVTNSDFWMEVLERAPQTLGFRRHLSKLVAEFCRQHPDIELPTFIAITSKEQLPEFKLAAALSFCQQPNFVLLTDSEESDLQDRCIACIAENWDEICWDESQIRDAFFQMEKGLVVKLLVEISASSQSRLGALTDELDDALADRNRLRREKRTLQKTSKSLKKEVASLSSSNALLSNKLRRKGCETEITTDDEFSSRARDRSCRKDRQLSLSSWAHESHVSEVRSAIDFRNVFDPSSSHTA